MGEAESGVGVSVEMLMIPWHRQLCVNQANSLPDSLGPGDSGDRLKLIGIMRGWSQSVLAQGQHLVGGKDGGRSRREGCISEVEVWVHHSTLTCSLLKSLPCAQR